MTSSIQVSVYMPTKNRALKAQRAIESVMGQTLTDLEMIVIDDGSTDETPAILASLQQRYGQRLRVQRFSESVGACRARNAGIEQAQGRWITGLDDDDYFLPDRLSSLLASFQPHWAFVCSAYLTRSGAVERRRADALGRIDYTRALHYNCIGSQVLTLTERLKALGGFDPALPAYQDYELFLRLLKAYGPGLKIPAASYVQDVGDDPARISLNPARLQRARRLVLNRYRADMTRAHRQSFVLQAYRNRRQALSLGAVARLLNRRNGKYALASYVSAYRAQA